MRQIAILGSTGSIGTQTLDVVREQKDLRVVSLAAGSNVEMMIEQIREFRPKVVCMYREESARELEALLKKEGIVVDVHTGMDGLITCACVSEAQIVVGAVVGMIGIRPVLEAIKAGKDIALANKETLVTAGHLILPAVRQHGVKLLPVDSEHSAIFQCLAGNEADAPDNIAKLYLTASGGTFRGRKKEELKNVTVEDTLKHPNWVMGKKITVDSATLVNKGLEVIEAKWLFGVDYDRIQVLIQPQSVIHSMIEYRDGAIMAQLGTPDMRTPIQYALYYPHRPARACEKLDFCKLGSISFQKPDDENFPALSLAYEVGREGHGSPTVYNAANEWAVAQFLNRKCGYPDIYESIKKAVSWWRKTGMDEMGLRNYEPELNQILGIERAVYDYLKKQS